MNDYSGLTSPQYGDRADGALADADLGTAPAASAAGSSPDAETELSQFRQLLFGDQLEAVERLLDRLEGAQAQAFERLQAEQRARFLKRLTLIFPGFLAMFSKIQILTA